MMVGRITQLTINPLAINSFAWQLAKLQEQELKRRNEEIIRQRAEAEAKQEALRHSIIGKRLLGIKHTDGGFWEDDEMVLTFEGGLSITIKSGASGHEVDSAHLDWSVVKDQADGRMA